MGLHAGYLVVLKVGEDEHPRNPAYRGIGNIPAYPSTLAEEAFAIDQYVFGGFKESDGNLIPDLQRAIALVNLFRESPREYEILWRALDTASATLTAHNYTPLGYDVVVINGDYWSIVADFPIDSFMAQYAAKLNRNGLFDEPEVALSFRREYVANKLADYDMEFEVVYCARVEGVTNR